MNLETQITSLNQEMDALKAENNANLTVSKLCTRDKTDCCINIFSIVAGYLPVEGQSARDQV